jgi:hypothetical protein
MNRLFGWAALAGFFAAVVVHIATADGLDVYASFPPVWLLHLGAILLFGVFVLSARRRKFSEVLQRLPVGAVLVFAVIFGYAILNVFLCRAFTGNVLSTGEIGNSTTG